MSLSNASRVDLILNDRRSYTYEAYAANRVSHCLTQAGIFNQSLYLSDGLLYNYLSYIQDNPPNWSLSFAHAAQNNQLLCDVLALPYFYWNEEGVMETLLYLNSHFAKVGVNNRHFVEQMKSNKLFYLPHGVESSSSQENRIFDVVIFADLIDLSWLKKSWEEELTQEELTIIEHAINAQDPFVALSHFFYAERYLKAQGTNQAVETLKKFSLEIFGEHAGKDWLVRLPQTTRLHAKLPYCEHFEVLKMSRVLIADEDCPWYYPALAAGCLPLPADEERVLFYLNSQEEREKKIYSLQNLVAERSWERQSANLVELMK